MGARDSVRHDATSLYRFIETICVFCSTDSEYPAYLDASTKFLSYIRDLGTATKEYLVSFPDKLPSDLADYKLYRQELATLRSAWFELHKRVKPTDDADVLHLPAPLICAVLRRLRSIPKFKDIELAVFHTEQLNYLQVVATNIRETARSIGNLIPGSKPFPAKLGLIGIPYSQSESLFLNCLIAHELGHFVFGEEQLLTALGPEIKSALTTAFTPVASKLNAQDRSWIPTIAADWVEELFCDLFAVLLIGPCYTYAFIEIFDLGNTLEQDGSLNRSAAATTFQFSASHPALAYRLKQQVEMLEKLGWWNEMSKSGSHYISVLKNAKSAMEKDFSFPLFPSVETNAIAMAFALANVVSTQVENALSPIDNGVAEYNRIRHVVSEYLRHGVVPSSVLDPKDGSTIHPSPVTILNVAYQLYLDALSDLIKSIEGQDATSVEHRNTWIQRLEMWTSKALDDHELLEKQREAKGRA
jgi:hypothetical protein